MGNLLERKSVLVVKNYLRAIDSTIKLIELDTTARTAKDAAQSLKVELGCIVKSLVFKSLKKNLYYLCLVSGDKFISEKKLSLIIDDEIEKASADQTKNYTGYSIGGVPPVGHSNSPTQICKITKGKTIDFVQ